MGGGNVHLVDHAGAKIPVYIHVHAYQHVEDTIVCALCMTEIRVHVHIHTPSVKDSCLYIIHGPCTKKCRAP